MPPTDLRQRRKEVVDELRQNLDVEDYLLNVLGVENLKNPGYEEVICSCPLPWGLHNNNDANPSFALNRNKLVWNCFVCGSGDIVQLTQYSLGVSQVEAFKILGKSLTPQDLSKEAIVNKLEALFQEGGTISKELPSYSDSVIARWEGYSEYLASRGVDEWIQMLMRTGEDARHREKVVVGETETFQTQRRVVIPVFFKDKLRGWQKRKTDDTAEGPKYKNSPGFPKDSVLYGYDSCKHDDLLIVVESPLSALYLRSLEIENVVATFGTSVSDAQINLMKEFDSVYLWLDDDKAGKKRTLQILRGQLKYHSNLYVIPVLGDGVDPGDLSVRELSRSLENKRFYTDLYELL